MTTTKVLLVAVCAAAVAVLMLKNSRGKREEPPQSPRHTPAPAGQAPRPLDNPSEVRALPAKAAATHKASTPPTLDELWAEAESLPDDHALIVGAFKKLGGSLKEEFVDRDIEGMIQSGFKGDRDAFEAALRRKGTSLEQFREQRRETMIIAVMRSRITRGITDPSAKEKAIEEWLSTLRKEADAATARLPGARGQED